MQSDAIKGMARTLAVKLLPPILKEMLKQTLRRFESAQLSIARRDIEADSYIAWLCRVVGGWLSVNDGNIVAFSYAITSMPRSGAIVEVGSFLGLSTNILAYLADKHGRDNPFFSVDPWVFEETENRVGGYFDASKGEFREYVKEVFKMNSSVFSDHRKPYAFEGFSSKFFELWWAEATVTDVFGRAIKLGGPISFAYVDGAHTYEGIRGDFLAVDRYLLPGGFILFDDTGYGSPFQCRNLMPEIMANPAYECILKRPNYLFRKKESEQRT